MADHESVEVAGPKRKCDICHGATAYYDGKTRFGAWANMCPDCFGVVGMGLGLGRGQRLVYVK